MNPLPSVLKNSMACRNRWHSISPTINPVDECSVREIRKAEFRFGSLRRKARFSACSAAFSGAASYSDTVSAASFILMHFEGATLGRSAVLAAETGKHLLEPIPWDAFDNFCNGCFGSSGPEDPDRENFLRFFYELCPFDHLSGCAAARLIF